MNTAVTFLILYLIHLIGVALIQDTFNDMEDGVNSPTGTFGPVGSPQSPPASSPQFAPPAIVDPLPPVSNQAPVNSFPPISSSPSVDGVIPPQSLAPSTDQPIKQPTSTPVDIPPINN